MVAVETRAPVQAQEPIRLEIPLPPSANNCFLNALGKGRVKTDAYRAWFDTVGLRSCDRAGFPAPTL